MRRAAVRTVLVLLGVVALLVALVWGFQRRLIYPRIPGPVPSAATVLDSAQDVSFETTDGLRLNAWYLPAGEPDLGVTVLVAHGNGGDRAGRAPLAAALARRGLAVLLVEYRGYGENPGDPTEDGLALDVRAARRYLVEEQRVPPERLLYFGESLGSAVVTELATEHPPAGLLLRSPFIDLAALARVHYPFLPGRALLRERYPLADQLARIEVPTTVVYGTRDTIVPPDQSRAVAERAGGPTKVVAVPGAGHNDRILLDGDALIDATVDLAEQTR